MPQSIELLGAALGLGALSGISLYLTVSVVGFSLHMGWLHLSPSLEPIQVLDNPWVWGVAMALYLVEFFADKVPWVDSAWDTVHTLIRPVGAMFVATKALGQVDGVVEVMGVLLAGTAAFATHATKAGTRLIANHSPEPFSNIALSLAEDVAVCAAIPFVMAHPVWTGVIAMAGIVAFGWGAPILFRAVKANFAFVLGKLWAWEGRKVEALANHIPAELDLALARAVVPGEKVDWAVRCITGRFPGAGRNVSGYLVATSAQSHVYFVGRRGWKTVLVPVPLAGTRIDVSRQFVFTSITLYSTQHGVLGSVRLTRRNDPEADLAAEKLRQLTATPVPAPEGPGMRLSPA
jgi:hypothetical protein